MQDVLHGRTHQADGIDPIGPTVEWEDVGSSGGGGTDPPRNVGELGYSGNTGQAAAYTHTVQFQDAAIGDAIMVAALAPSLPVTAGARGVPVSCTDSKGHTYSVLSTHLFEAATPNVNEGAVLVVFFTPAITTPLVKDTDTITVTWSNPVFDRQVYAWHVRNPAGPLSPTLLAATANSDAAVFASSQVTLTAPAWTPARDSSLELAMVLAVRAGGLGGFGGVGGYSGFFQAQARSFAGSKQTYVFNVQTFGADVLLIVGAAHPQYEIDKGTLPGGTPVAAFNGVGQNYSSGANAWKGIVLEGIR